MKPETKRQREVEEVCERIADALDEPSVSGYGIELALGQLRPGDRLPNGLVVVSEAKLDDFANETIQNIAGLHEEVSAVERRAKEHAAMLKAAGE